MKGKSVNSDKIAKKFIECYTCGKKGQKSTECLKIVMKNDVVIVDLLHIRTNLLKR